MTDREVMRQALEALKKATKHLPVHFDSHFEAITALQEKLAEDALQRLTNVQQEIEAALEKQAEPVAWRTFDGEGGYDYRTYEDNEDYAAEWAKRNPRHVGWVDPLYTTPPQRKPLTDELYNELLFAVGKKYPNETRHQIALRYIRQAEMPSSEPAKAAHGIKETP